MDIYTLVMCFRRVEFRCVSKFARDNGMYERRVPSGTGLDLRGAHCVEFPQDVRVRVLCTAHPYTAVTVLSRRTYSGRPM